MAFIIVFISIFLLFAAARVCPYLSVMLPRSPKKQKVTFRLNPELKAEECLLKEPFFSWFQSKGWKPRSHQIEVLKKSYARKSTLLIAPTGAGKTLSGFLPSLVTLSSKTQKQKKYKRHLHTLYISPLKALAADVARNLASPIEEMGLPIRYQTRSGDTASARRQQQKNTPPDILMTTPEQLALLLSHEDAPSFFGSLDTLILDELHTLAASKRGDLLALNMARLRSLAPNHWTIGLSATIARPSELCAYLVAQPKPHHVIYFSDLILADQGAAPEIQILEDESNIPWGGHSARYAIPKIYEAIEKHRLTLIFVNTRMQAELIFQELWHINDKGLRIALHHGSLSAEKRNKVEKAMAKGNLKAVVATSTLELGIDWGNVDLVINFGAPKGSSRLIQRVGRSNHRVEEPSRGILVPANRFEVLECRAALEAAKCGEQDVFLERQGALDVLAQHVLGMACQSPFFAQNLFLEVRSCLPYRNLDFSTFNRVIDFVSTGGYALRAYERFAKLKLMEDSRLRLSHPRLAHQYRLNAGTIIDNPMIKVRLARQNRKNKNTVITAGQILGQVEEFFIEQLTSGDTFVFGGEILRFERLEETDAICNRAPQSDPKIPSYMGGRFPLSTNLAQRVRAMIGKPRMWSKLPLQVAEWLELQRRYSLIPSENEVLVETFPRGERYYLVLYPFEGRLAHQTLGMLLTRRLQRLGARPLGFVANDYAVSIWTASSLSKLISQGLIDLKYLLEEDILGDDLDAWLAESNLMKRTFRDAAIIAGLIQKRHGGREKSGRQVTMSTDLIYDVLRKHEPGHILLEIAWTDAATGLLDIKRLGAFLKRIKGRIKYQALDQVSPLSVPLLLEIGREPVAGSAREDLMRDYAEELIRAATKVGAQRNHGNLSLKTRQI